MNYTLENMKGSAHFTGRFEVANGKTLAFCNELPIGGIGDTPEEAMQSFARCLRTYLKSAMDAGNLREVLMQHGAILPYITETAGGFTMTMPATGGLGALAPAV